MTKSRGPKDLQLEVGAVNKDIFEYTYYSVYREIAGKFFLQPRSYTPIPLHQPEVIFQNISKCGGELQRVKVFASQEELAMGGLHPPQEFCCRLLPSPTQQMQCSVLANVLQCVFSGLQCSIAQ